jgi:DNA-binding XRE family transcriptional regulator
MRKLDPASAAGNPHLTVALSMHLIWHGPNIVHRSFYPNTPALSRVDTLPYFFRRMRQHYNLTQSVLAEKLLVKGLYVAEVEAGLRLPTLKYCLQCGDLFGANPNWIKNKWANERVLRFRSRLEKALDLDDNGGG